MERPGQKSTSFLDDLQWQRSLGLLPPAIWIAKGAVQEHSLPLKHFLKGALGNGACACSTLLLLGVLLFGMLYEWPFYSHPTMAKLYKKSFELAFFLFSHQLMCANCYSNLLLCVLSENLSVSHDSFDKVTLSLPSPPNTVTSGGFQQHMYLF